jgi:amidophosphoribosyltransferase
VNPDSFCAACFTGQYPVTIPEPVKRTKLVLEAASKA